MHEKSDKLSLIKLNFMENTSFLRSKYTKQIVTYKMNHLFARDKLS